MHDDLRQQLAETGVGDHARSGAGHWPTALGRAADGELSASRPPTTALGVLARRNSQQSVAVDYVERRTEARPNHAAEPVARQRAAYVEITRRTRANLELNRTLSGERGRFVARRHRHSP